MPRAIMVAASVLLVGCMTIPSRVPAPQRVVDRASAPDAGAAASGTSTRPAREVPARYSVLGCIRAPEVDRWERRLAREEAAWNRMVRGRGGDNYRAVRRIVAEEGLPPGLAYLPAIESGYRRTATGPTGARGLWQFGAGTARNYGLVVNGRRDDRLDVELSTRAALRHLRDLHRRYGTWPLALAAYNAGEGRVQRALSRDDDGTFWQLAEKRRLPPVTRSYVPKFLALVRLMSDGGPCSPDMSVVATAE